MALKIRLKRMGKRNLPFYRLVVVDSRWRRDGKTVADIGWYDPVKEPAQVSLREKDIYQWLENGAQLSETARSLLKNYGILGRFKDGSYKSILASEENTRIDDIPETRTEEPVSPLQETVESEAKTETAPEPQPEVTETEKPAAEATEVSSEEDKSS